LDWPGNSPDPARIETAWGLTKQQVCGKHYTKRDVSKEAANKYSDALSTSTLPNLMLSILRRLKKVLKLNGGCTDVCWQCSQQQQQHGVLCMFEVIRVLPTRGFQCTGFVKSLRNSISKRRFAQLQKFNFVGHV
jgi:hypothetical protein